MIEKLFCPICNSKKFNSISQDLHKCKSCAVIFNSNHRHLDYNEDYFISDYENQYGKTYIQDFPNIYALANKRFDIIADIINKKRNLNELKLLDIGSAAGFFLKCAKDRGMKNLLGIEISTFASDYCQKEFSIDSINKPFDQVEIENNYDIISAWYFIEHCEKPAEIFFKIFSSLRIGGVFAFSTPSSFGPQFILKKSLWIEQHPDDHSVDFSPKSITKLLKKIGFTKVIVKPSGIHPGRVIGQSNIFYLPFSKIYVLFSKMFKFSDTMEIYAVK